MSRTLAIPLCRCKPGFCHRFVSKYKPLGTQTAVEAANRIAMSSPFVPVTVYPMEGLHAGHRRRATATTQTQNLSTMAAHSVTQQDTLLARTQAAGIVTAALLGEEETPESSAHQALVALPTKPEKQCGLRKPKIAQTAWQLHRYDWVAEQSAVREAFNPVSAQMWQEWRLAWRSIQGSAKFEFYCELAKCTVSAKHGQARAPIPNSLLDLLPHATQVLERPGSSSSVVVACENKPASAIHVATGVPFSMAASSVRAIVAALSCDSHQVSSAVVEASLDQAKLRSDQQLPWLDSAILAAFISQKKLRRSLCHSSCSFCGRLARSALCGQARAPRDLRVLSVRSRKAFLARARAPLANASCTLLGVLGCARISTAKMRSAFTNN